MVMRNTRRPMRLKLLSTDVKRVVLYAVAWHDNLDVLCNNMGLMGRSSFVEQKSRSRNMK